MNYIKEINSFYDWLETNPTTDSSIVLWHALMHINNKCGWRQEFAVAISSIQNKTGLSKSSILRARNGLQQSGRVNFTSRNGQLSATYKIIAFHTDTQTATQSEAQTATQSEAQTVTITKLNKTKLNKTSKSHSGANAPAKKKTDLLFWKSFVKKFSDWYQSKINEPYNFLEQDWAHLKKIYKFFQKRASEKSMEFSEKNLLDGFEFFLQKAWDKDDWLRRNFSIANILSQFNQIVNDERAKQFTQKGGQPTGASVNSASAISKLARMSD